jgi:hypothetical protein
MPREKVERELRQWGEPITLFAETDRERIVRMLEKKKERERVADAAKIVGADNEMLKRDANATSDIAMLEKDDAQLTKAQLKELDRPAFILAVIWVCKTIRAQTRTILLERAVRLLCACCVRLLCALAVCLLCACCVLAVRLLCALAVRLLCACCVLAVCACCMLNVIAILAPVVARIANSWGS